jgi:hypothetical protein
MADAGDCEGRRGNVVVDAGSGRSEAHAGQLRRHAREALLRRARELLRRPGVVQIVEVRGARTGDCGGCV